MDKRSRLLQDLQNFSSKSSRDSCEIQDLLNYDSSDQDLRLEGLPTAHSEFGEDTESDDDLECHLPLLVPEELQNLGLNALRAGNHDAAIRYLNMSQLRATENLGKRLAGASVSAASRMDGSGSVSVQLNHEAIFQQWALSTYLEAAITRAPFVELPQMLQLFKGMLAEGTKQAEVSARVNEDLAHSELRTSLMLGR